MIYFFHKHNRGWSVKQLAKEIKKENPTWDSDKCFEQAEIVYKELNKLNSNTYKNEKKHIENTVPFSFDYYLEEGDFEEFNKSDYYKLYYKGDIDNKIIKLIIKDLDKEC